MTIDGVNEGANDGVNLDSTDKAILKLIEANPSITKDTISKKTGKSLSTIERRIRKLKGKFIERIGSDKTGHWKIIK